MKIASQTTTESLVGHDLSTTGTGSPAELYWLLTDSAHYACETTAFLNRKYSNTTYISKIWPE